MHVSFPLSFLHSGISLSIEFTFPFFLGNFNLWLWNHTDVRNKSGSEGQRYQMNSTILGILNPERALHRSRSEIFSPVSPPYFSLSSRPTSRLLLLRKVLGRSVDVCHYLEHCHSLKCIMLWQSM